MGLAIGRSIVEATVRGSGPRRTRTMAPRSISRCRGADESTGICEIDLAGNAPLEERQMLRPADARDQQVQIVELCRVDLDERPRQKISLLLVVALEGHGITRLEQGLQCLDDRSGLQHTPLHPRREPGQARGLPRPSSCPAARLSVDLNGRFHAVTSQAIDRPFSVCTPLGYATSHHIDHSPFYRGPEVNRIAAGIVAPLRIDDAINAEPASGDTTP
jgi:hypothetical protein